jgi:hypothetical protein
MIESRYVQISFMADQAVGVVKIAGNKKFSFPA